MWSNAEIALESAVDMSGIPEEGFSEEVARRKTKLLKSLKYDGVIVTTSKTNRNFHEVVAFDSEQIKLTTNKNPTKNPDMRYSSQQTDIDYMDALNRGDMETVQKMVAEAAKRSGHDTLLYHGTGAFGFTNIDNKKSNDRKNNAPGFASCRPGALHYVAYERKKTAVMICRERMIGRPI